MDIDDKTMFDTMMIHEILLVSTAASCAADAVPYVHRSVTDLGT